MLPRPLGVEYVDYALWQRLALGDVLDVYRDYWREHLKEGALPVLELPLDYPRPALQTFNGDVVGVSPDGGAVVQIDGCEQPEVVQPEV